MTSSACPRCGKEVPPQSKTCPHCQFALEIAAEEALRHKTPKWIWWILGIVLACPLGVGLVATLTVPSVLRRFVHAKQRKAETDLITLEEALDEYALNNGLIYPDSLEALLHPDAHGEVFIKMSSIPGDAWGRAYHYAPPTPERPRPRVYTLGKDGKLGGKGEDADIDNLMLEAPK